MADTIDIAVKEQLDELSARLAAIDGERALLVAQIEALRPGATKREHPANHGKAWTREEKDAVADLFTQGRAIKDIAEMHQRTRGSIRSELIRQGLIEVEPTQESPPERKETDTPKRMPVSAQASNGSAVITREFADAFELLENTSHNVFLTGKAGTGKSTFLHYFRGNTRKKIAVVAPTGVAALNVQGQTIHSFFNLKPGFVNVREFKPARRRIFKELELLIIDEISMVRADVFDGMDHTLRLARKDNRPFGGVQICVIGDLFQLPPVVSPQEKTFYGHYYRSPFFFCTHAYESAAFKTVQFGTIHRQNDIAFIQILNAIRAGACDAIELEALNSRVNPKAAPAPGTLVLTTTNMLAEQINSEKLARLSGGTRGYDGALDGTFGMQGGRLPAPGQLTLKPGAQVMFVKNDSDGRWVNGTIGRVEKLDAQTIDVRVGDAIHGVERETWKSIGYELDKATGTIIEKELGSYTQFPLVLAWAITIHKSQGKTLERVIIDLGNGAFAPGQLYVALSRCKSLSGIALKTPVTQADIRCDAQVVEFMRKLQYP